MTTIEATLRLAWIWEMGGYSDAAMAIEQCKAQSRAWNWDKANTALGRAYAALGASAPDADVNALHTGSHPVQVAAAEGKALHPDAAFSVEI